MAASTYTAERIRRLTERWQYRIRRVLDEAVGRMRPTSLAALAELIEQGRALEALSLVESTIAAVADEADDALVAAARDAALWLGTALNVTVSFDRTNFRAVEAMRASRLSLIQGFTQGQRDAVRRVLVDAVARGLNPREAAREFRSSVGLTDSQVEAVARYRRLLESNSRDALRRELRDRRYDRTVRGAIDRGRPLPKETVDRMVDAYRRRYLRYRSETIARTEALRAVHEGMDQLLRQAVDSGAVTSDEIVRSWSTARDERVRGSHRPMHGQRRTQSQLDQGELFVSGRGNRLSRPGDPRAPVSEVARCRCGLTMRYVEDQDADEEFGAGEDD